MKKFLSCLLVLVLIFALSSCGGSGKTEKENAADQGVEIALVMTAEGSIDDRGFFEGTYTGIKQFCDETGRTYGYYNPTENSADAIYETIDMAVLNGAKVICIAGTGFIGMMEEVFAAYPDVFFVCNELHGTEAGENSVIYIYKAQEATFLAGVAAVYEGYTQLGVICGKQIPANLNGGYGFMQGVNWAAGELGVESVDLKYWYSNSFEPSADIQAYAAAWYENGTELIAAFCGSAAPSIYAAAEGAGGKSMGCDTDQSALSDTIVTSFLKNVHVMTYKGLVDWEAGAIEGGQVVDVGIEDGAVGLVMDNARFENFTQEQYDEIVERYLAGEMGELLDYTAAERPDAFYDLLAAKNMSFTYYE